MRLAPDGPCPGLVQGGQVEVELELAADGDAGAERVVAVPVAAIVEVRATSVLFVASGPPGQYEVRAIEPGPQLGDERVVKAGVAEGDEIVVEGAVLLKGELLRGELGGEE